MAKIEIGGGLWGPASISDAGISKGWGMAPIPLGLKSLVIGLDLNRGICQFEFGLWKDGGHWRVTDRTSIAIFLKLDWMASYPVPRSIGWAGLIAGPNGDISMTSLLCMCVYIYFQKNSKKRKKIRKRENPKKTSE